MGSRLVIVLVLGLWCTVQATGDDTLLLERIAITRRASAVSPAKIEAALILAARLSRRYTLLPLRDSVVQRGGYLAWSGELGIIAAGRNPQPYARSV